MALDPYQLARAGCAACLLGLLALPATAEFGEITATGEDIEETRAFAQWIWKLGGNN